MIEASEEESEKRRKWRIKKNKGRIGNRGEEI